MALAIEVWPGPLTLIVPRGPNVLDAVTGGQSTVGLRVPSHPLTLRVLSEFGGGLAAPSANRYGHVSPTTAQHVVDELATCWIRRATSCSTADGAPSASSRPSSEPGTTPRGCCAPVLSPSTRWPRSPDERCPRHRRRPRPGHHGRPLRAARTRRPVEPADLDTTVATVTGTFGLIALARHRASGGRPRPPRLAPRRRRVRARALRRAARRRRRAARRRGRRAASRRRRRARGARSTAPGRRHRSVTS